MSHVRRFSKDFDFIMDDGPVPTVEIPKPKPTSTASAPSIDMDVYDFISGDDFQTWKRKFGLQLQSDS